MVRYQGAGAKFQDTCFPFVWFPFVQSVRQTFPSCPFLLQVSLSLSLFFFFFYLVV